jgi:long-chain fatty acid transport protein
MQMIKEFVDARTPGVGTRVVSRTALVFVAAIVALGVVAQTAFAGGFALSGIGSRAISMGGAFRGLADDWSAAYWNPAGLTQFEGSQLNAMLVGISQRPQYEPEIFYGDSLGVGYRNGQVRYPNDKTRFIPDFSGFLKLNAVESFIFGVAVFVPFGLGGDWDLFNPEGMDLNSSFPGIDHQADLNVMDIHPTVAKGFLDNKLSVGAGLSIQRGNITFRKTYLMPSGIPVPHENLVVDTKIKGRGWGFGANFGVLYKFSGKLQVGVSGKTGSKLKFKGTARQEMYTFNNEDLKRILLSSALTYPETLQILFLFAPSNHISTPKANADLKTPADIGFGIAVKPNDKLTITGDVTYTNWKSLDSILVVMNGVDPSGQPAQNSPIMLKWKNTVRFSAGAEYWAKKFLAIRLGYYFDPSPMPDETFIPLIPDMGDKNSFNLGAALKLSQFEVAYNLECMMFKDRTIAASALEDVNNDGVFDNYPGAFKMKLYASHISLTYRF